MSAVLKKALRLVRMQAGDLPEVLEIENSIYTHPWTRGNFSDSLRSAYECWTWRLDQELLGYFVLLVAAGEGHLLNLSVAASRHRSGYGSELLKEVLRLAQSRGAQHLYLEVRPSNLAAKALYRRFGFHQAAVRPGYYPAHDGREDALVLTLAL